MLYISTEPLGYVYYPLIFAAEKIDVDMATLLQLS